MVVTLDITDDVTDIHPVNKPDVGKRLANLALSGTYGFTGIACSGPEFRKLEIDGKAIRLYFDHAEQGLLIRDHARESGFMIAGSDRHFCPAKAFVEGESIVVRSGRVKEPVAVRYAFSNTSVATLFNGEGLPASTFRTDAWPLYTEMVFIRPEYDATSGILTYGLLCPDQDARIHYTTDGTEPSCNSGIFTKGHLTVASDARITARACLDGNPSESIGSWFVNIHKGIASKVDYVNEYSRKYSAGGRYGLVDGIEGSLSFNDGAWQGFEGEDLLVTIDLGEPTMIRKVVVRFLSDTVSWIFLPRHVEIKTSLNGFHFDTGARFDNLSSLSPVYEKPGKEIVPVRAGFIKNARYIRINARNIGICPAGHPGAGGKAWLFTDEIVIE
jgi:hypothetical protein